MARPHLVLETWGRITRTKTAQGVDMAVARYRDSDGKTRRMARTGATPHKAEQELIRALRDRLTPSEGLAPTTRLSVLAEYWWEEWLEAKERPIGTERRYRNVLDSRVLTGLGEITVREATVSRLDRFLKAVTAKSRSDASISRVLLSGMLGLAARHGAIATNPVASCAPIPKRKSNPKAWTVEEIEQIMMQLREWDDGEDARRFRRTSDLADPSDFMLGTGCRIGETFAARWDDFDFDAPVPTVRVHATVVRGENFGLEIQEHTKSKKSRVLKLPPFLVEILLRRRETSVTDLVFPSSTGTVRGPDNYRTQWRKALGSDDIPDFDKMPKTFRSSVGTHIANIDGSFAAQRTLGHSSVTITEESYIAHQEFAPDVTATLEQLASGHKRPIKDQSADSDLAESA